MGRLKSVLGQFLATVHRHGLLPKGSRVLVAVSGGADSVCLLDLLQAMARRWNLKLFGFHMNHGLRTAAKRDEEFVRRIFARAGLELVVVHSDVSGYARGHRVGLEQAGRTLRYRNLHRAAGRLDCGRIALGHTADDNLETMLFNLARGAGLHGLAGIVVRRDEIVRPLIDVEHQRIVRYLRARKISWVEDETNKELRFSRNLIRHRVAARLLEVNPAAVANARRTARMLEQEDGYLDALAAQALDRVAVSRGRRTLIDTRLFESYNVVLKRRMVKQLVPELDSEGVERMLEFCKGGSAPGLTLRKTVQLLRRDNTVELILSRKRNSND